MHVLLLFLICFTFILKFELNDDLIFINNITLLILLYIFAIIYIAIQIKNV